MPDIHRVEVAFRYPDDPSEDDVMLVMSFDNDTISRATLARVLAEGLRGLANELLEADFRLPA